MTSSLLFICMPLTYVQVIELLLERDLSLRCQWMAEATSDYRSIVEGILQLCLYSAPSRMAAARAVCQCAHELLFVQRQRQHC